MGADAVHPTDQTLHAYGLGKLDDVSSASVSKHLESCPSCQRRVAEVSSDSFLGQLRGAQGAAEMSAIGGRPQPGGSFTDRGPDVATAPPPADTMPPGLADHRDYEVIRELGRGGMGVVYLARNKLMGRLEVLKVVGGHLIERPGVRDRFLREVQSAAKLQHKNIVAAYSAMRFGASIVLAMEYIDGEDLAHMVKTRGPLPVVHACYFIYQAALGLQHAHERGMVHRDIKPANLIFATEGKKGAVKVLDFGLAKICGEGPSDSGLTREGQMLGTPDYIAPEQIRDAQSADIRADIYSLGCTLYYLLTGAPPFRGEHLWDVYQAHFSMEAGPLNLVCPEVPVELAAVVAKMMAKEPRRRFQTPGEVAKALTAFFKPAATQPTRPSAEMPRLETQVASTRPLSAVPGPAQPATLATAPTAAGRQPQKIGTDGVAWESLIEIKEDEPLIEAAKPKRAEPKPAPAEAQVRRPPWVWRATIAASVFGVLALGAIIYVATDKGRIKIEYEPKVSNREGTNRPTSRSTEKPSSDAAPPGSIENSIGMTLKLIPAGEFMMGSPDSDKDAGNDEKPPHRVQITRPFYLGAYEVTQGQFRAVTGANPSGLKGSDDLPMEFVSWEDAMAFCSKLNELEKGQLRGEIYRLPTEAEWEYACRAGMTTRFGFGDDEGALGEYAWFSSNSGGKNHRVGQKRPNAWGLYDMQGNVFEWCWDWYDAKYYVNSPGTDPPGASGSWGRVRRSIGTWGDPLHCRAAQRSGLAPGYRGRDVGFRVARVAGDRGPIGLAPAPAPSEATRAIPPQPGPVEPTRMPVEPSKTITNTVGMKLVLIPAGAFLMGSPESDKDAHGDEKPQHRVRITRPFYLGATEVTQGQYRSVTGANPSGFKGSDDLPVEQVTWEDARAFCEKLSALEKPRLGGAIYRLPTEAEWEYACRAGTTTRFGFGDEAGALGEYAWFADNSGRKTHPVGQKRSNAWGLYDMQGNVREWCWDWYEWKYYETSPGTDPSGASGSWGRACRGGCWVWWSDISRNCRSAYRDGNTPGCRFDGVGFRVARSASGL